MMEGHCSKYPCVVVFRHRREEPGDDPFFSDTSRFDCCLHLTSDRTDLNRLFDPSYQVLVTWGGDEAEYLDEVNSVIAPRMRRRWIHFQSPQNLSVAEFSRAVTYCFVDQSVQRDRGSTRPTFSVFTTTFNTYDKISRPYSSLSAQTLLDWEWVVVDDSPDDRHFQFLRSRLAGDARVRLYRRAANSGNIGNVKNEAAALCRGAYLLELDHDDEITPELLDQARRCFEEDPEVGFLYADFVNLYEENRDNFRYILSPGFGLGYAGYYSQRWADGRWRYVHVTPRPNPTTLSHLVALPNHPRMWRASAFRAAGNYCEFLPVNDDQELLMRTAQVTRFGKLCLAGYVQYMNRGGNNFSLIRNAEINRIGPYFLQPQFYKEWGLAPPKWERVEVWREEQEPQYFESKLFNPLFDEQLCFLSLDSLRLSVIGGRDLRQPRTEYIVLDAACSQELLWATLEDLGLTHFRCLAVREASAVDAPAWSLPDLTRYFERVLRATPRYELDHSGFLQRPLGGQKFPTRAAVINLWTRDTARYLEVGVDCGETFRAVRSATKQGVDPAPRFFCDQVFVGTSDQFFGELPESTVFDVVFVDGLHTATQVWRDLCNSLAHLAPEGCVLLDDVLPTCHEEQAPRPLRTVLHEGVPKAAVAWTGDVWKVLYHVLKHGSFAEVSVYSHPSYRGIAALRPLSSSAWEVAAADPPPFDTYDYWRDFGPYLELIEAKLQ